MSHLPDGKPEDIIHYPVMYKDVLEHLHFKEGDVVLDGTLGRGGHASLIMPLLGTEGHYIGLDVDDEAIAFCRKKFGLSDDQTVEPEFKPTCKMSIVKSNFADAPQVLESLGLLDRGVDVLLADLGISSVQLGDGSRGISFQYDGPLDMRLDPTLPNTAADFVNQLPEEQLAAILFYFGEEKLSRRIARAIVEERERDGFSHPILTSKHLADVVSAAIPSKVRQQSSIHPATKTFMALRIAVNKELVVLNDLLKAIPQLLAPGGVCGIITFHSLEDRLVKIGLKELAAEQAVLPSGEAVRLVLPIKSPILPSPDELRENPRSRSAKFRLIQRLEETNDSEEEDESSEESDADREQSEESNHEEKDSEAEQLDTDQSSDAEEEKDTASDETAPSEPAEAQPTLVIRPLEVDISDLLTASGQFYKQLGKKGRGRRQENEQRDWFGNEKRGGGGRRRPGGPRGRGRGRKPNHKSQNFTDNPKAYGNVDFEDIFFESKTGKQMHGWYIKGPPFTPILVYCCGNADGVNTRSHIAVKFAKDLKCSVLFYDYLGFGQSSPQLTQSHKLLRESMEAAMDLAASYVNSQSATTIWIYAHSFGCTVALQWCSKHLSWQQPTQDMTLPVNYSKTLPLLSFITLECPFESLITVGRHLIGTVCCRCFARCTSPCILSHSWNSAKFIQSVPTPTLIVSSERDELIPEEDADSLFDLSHAEIKERVVIPQGWHNANWNRDGHYMINAMIKIGTEIGCVVGKNVDSYLLPTMAPSTYVTSDYESSPLIAMNSERNPNPAPPPSDQPETWTVIQTQTPNEQNFHRNPE
ncbi:putative Ribosomal RNA small subunit methyltransferase H [Blattamonas nauphoetae]|uniref:Ribosomal RNA small subunit methyltransferase H n=1 Tax=Blattamonas nauphoetae TaxID=2049346 RepID=A0ABQ9Y082_9EUKA|nr:putative Ribosomal RNA small subunit methyltransferase H [Blattamonas nauphoetae]